VKANINSINGLRTTYMAKLAAKSDVSGSVWKIEVTLGQKVAQGDTLVLIESMKMEIPVVAETAGTVASILVAEGDGITEGQSVVTLET
jgi:acetyl-CoA carboxylase biotin carboxyl carrier protein